MTRSRGTFTSQEKATIVLRHLIDKTPVDPIIDFRGSHRATSAPTNVNRRLPSDRLTGVLSSTILGRLVAGIPG